MTAEATGTITGRVAGVLPTLQRHAREIDEAASFPVESLRALRRSGLLGLLVPPELGGLGAGPAEFAEVAAELAGACLSSAMIWAMHCQQVAAIGAHGTEALRKDLLPRVADGEVYVASVTSERGKGGHLLTADAPLRADGDTLRFERDAPIVTGGTVADGFLITLRDSPEAGHDDVSLIYADRTQLTVTEGAGNWNPMGMRGTHSVPLRLAGAVDETRLVGRHGEFRAVATSTFVPLGHIGWAACWLGAARGALRDVLDLLRDPGARSQFDLTSDLLRDRLARVRLDLDTTAALLAQVIRDLTGPADPDSHPVQLRLNALKVHAAQRCTAVVDTLIEVVGLRHGYLRDAPSALERVFRDLRSASLNYANDRLLNANGALTLLDRTVSLTW